MNLTEILLIAILVSCVGSCSNLEGINEKIEAPKLEYSN